MKSPEIKASEIKKVCGGRWAVFVVCPYCHQTHEHNGGKLKEPLLGWRQPPCADDFKKEGYFISDNGQR